MLKKILVIDNDADFVESVCALLNAKGYKAIFANSGKEGIEKLQSEKVDMVLLDIMMERRTEGIEVVKKIKNNIETQNIPVIIITGIRKKLNLTFGFEVDEKWLPAKTILEKPVKPEVILKTIEEIFNENASSSE